MAGRLGVCSWSLQPASAADLVQKIKDAGLGTVQLALDPIREDGGGGGGWDEAETARLLGQAGIEVASGMMGMKGEDYSTLDTIRQTGGVRLDEHWAENLEAAGANAALAQRLGITLVTFHAGFIPHDRDEPLRGVMLERLRAIVDRFAEHDVEVAFETGQETADTLIEALDDLDRPAVGVNFDPANMILYGMGDPVMALDRLKPWIRQLHLKDAIPSATPGQWGREVPIGEGAVDWAGFFGKVYYLGLDCDLMIEREAGEQRIRDIILGRELAQQHLDSEAT